MYKIRLPNFEGPFDLLLYFIKRDEVNIYDIPIARIAGEFLNYIRIMQQFDIELASEFILMASELMYIKTQMLLPKPKNEDGEEVEDPRTELVRKLLEYKQIKEVSSELAERADSSKYLHYREYFNSDIEIAKELSPYKNATLFDLIKAYDSAIKRVKDSEYKHTVELFEMSVEEKRNEIVKKLNISKRITFFDLILNENKKGIVLIFLAILELIKTQTIIITQSETNDDISIGLRPNLN